MTYKHPGSLRVIRVSIAQLLKIANKLHHFSNFILRDNNCTALHFHADNDGRDSSIFEEKQWRDGHVGGKVKRREWAKGWMSEAVWRTSGTTRSLNFIEHIGSFNSTCRRAENMTVNVPCRSYSNNRVHSELYLTEETQSMIVSFRLRNGWIIIIIGVNHIVSRVISWYVWNGWRKYNSGQNKFLFGKNKLYLERIAEYWANNKIDSLNSSNFLDSIK